VITPSRRRAGGGATTTDRSVGVTSSGSLGGDHLRPDRARPHDLVCRVDLDHAR
jgi:hypothetical protein